MNDKMKSKTSWTTLLDNNGNNVKKSTPGSKMATTSNKGAKSMAIIAKTSNNSSVNSNTNSTTTTTATRTTTTTTTTTMKSRSSSIIMVRPKTLNVNREEQNAEAKLFIGEALNAWRAKARCSVVPAERLQELFHELQFYPSEKQISEMLQTAKVFARKGSRQLNGLTFGEFCVLAADLKRFRMCNFSSSNETKFLNFIPTTPDVDAIESTCNPKILTNTTTTAATTTTMETEMENNSHRTNLPLENRSTTAVGTITSSTNLNNPSTASTENNAPEVFLGGSCNPTTWRADVAIPTLQKLGISFYNPQVSDWTPDLIELEHRAKEKARVLFFVMDSETRASAGAIEAAHIAGQNARQLVLVLHPYKSNQCILNEPISPQEYLDLSRNQQLLRELVTRRGLPVLDNIPSGLQRTKQILAGIRDPPTNIASILLVVRGAFNRVMNSIDDEITIQQCQRALSFLGYANSLLSIENLSNVIVSQRDCLESCSSPSLRRRNTNNNSRKDIKEMRINFDEFCVLAAYLSVLQQEIHESGCISPIKGTNLPPPPIFLTNMQAEGIRGADESVTITTSYSKQIFRTASCTSVPEDRQCIDYYRNRDSGTSSPQPIESVKSKYIHIGKRSKISFNLEYTTNGETGGDESDSNDSVFSSGSSINSSFCDSFTGLEFRDVYLGGSCYLRTKWRQDYAIPYLTSKGISYHLPSLHESIPPSQLDTILKSGGQIINCSNKKSRIRRKSRNLKNTPDDDEDFGESSWPLIIRPNLFNPSLLDSSRVLLFVITNETRSLAPMTLAAYCIGLMYNVVLCVQMLPEFCKIGDERLTPTAIKDYNRGRSYLIDLAKRQGVPVFNDLKSSLECTIEKVRACSSRNSV